MKKRLLKQIALSAFGLMLCHCASINLVIPTATIESPETMGKSWKKEMGPSLEPAFGIQYTPDASVRPPSVDAPTYNGDTHSLQHRVSFGIAERFQWGISIGIDPSSDTATSTSGYSESYTATGKFQFLGPSRLKAKAGDWSAGLFTKFTYADNSKNGDQNGALGPGGFQWKADVTAKTLMLGLTTGYRLYNNWLIYGGGSYQNIQSKLVINQDATTDLSDAGGVYVRERNGFSTALGLGSQLGLGKVFAFNLKLMAIHFELDGLETKDIFSAAGGVSFYW